MQQEVIQACEVISVSHKTQPTSPRFIIQASRLRGLVFETEGNGKGCSMAAQPHLLLGELSKASG